MIGFTVRNVDIDELKSKITVYGWLRMQWDDNRLKWPDSKYHYIEKFRVLSDRVWLPDIMLFNSATDSDDHLSGGRVTIYTSGAVFWIPTAVYTAYCSLNLQLWPFDTQECHLQIGSWSLTDLDYSFYIGPGEVDMYVENHEWEVLQLNTTFEYDKFCNSVKFNFKFVRRAAIYKALIFIPASCIAIMMLSSFWLPPQMGEKLVLNGIVIVVISVFLIYFAQLLPVLAENTPLVLLFYSSGLLLASVSTTISVVVLYLSSERHRRRVPTFLRNRLNGYLRYILCLSHLSSDTEPQCPRRKELADQNSEGQANFEDQQSKIASTARSVQFDWIVLATAIDRIFFLLYCIVFIVLAILKFY